MTLWSSEIKELKKLYESLEGQLPELAKELERLIKADDENMILLYSRRCLEVIITDLCECELRRDRGTEPLKGIVDKLNKEKKTPPHIIASMHGLIELSTYGAHPKDFEPEQVKPVLINLDIIIKWYLKYKEAGSEIKAISFKENIHELKPAKNVKKSNIIPKKSIIGIVTGLILLIVIVVAILILTGIAGSGRQTKELEKSIAVLPFRNDSPDSTNQYFIDGTMEAILDNLCKISDLTVVSRTSVEQFRKTTKPVREIAKRLNVNYILEGSGQKSENEIRITVQLIDANKDKHIWSYPYEGEATDIFKLESRIAESIAAKLKVLISSEEKQLIEKPPSISLTAYDFYQRGREEYWNFWSDNTNREALKKAELFYRRALNYDSSFAQAISGLAWVYYYNQSNSDYFSENFMDSVLILANIAGSYNNQLSEVYTLRGAYHHQKGESKLAIEEYHKAIRFNPNDWMAYSALGDLYVFDDLVKAIDNYYKAAFINRGEQLPDLLRKIGTVCSLAGFQEKAWQYFNEALNLDNDSLRYYYYMMGPDLLIGNLEKTIEYGTKILTVDSTYFVKKITFLLLQTYAFLGNYEESLKYLYKYLGSTQDIEQSDLGSMWLIGIVFYKNGYKEKADFYFNETIKRCNKIMALGRAYAEESGVYYDLAAVYAFRGEKDKAYENLKIFNKKQKMSIGDILSMKRDPLFDGIRDEPEYQQIVRDGEAKYRIEHERVKKWLEEQGMLTIN